MSANVSFLVFFLKRVYFQIMTLRDKVNFIRTELFKVMHRDNSLYSEDDESSVIRIFVRYTNKNWITGPITIFKYSQD